MFGGVPTVLITSVSKLYDLSPKCLTPRRFITYTGVKISGRGESCGRIAMVDEQ